MRPSYFDPTPQPDAETQYRQGGKVNKMQKLSVAKKMPRKFQAGGMAKPTDKITPEMRAKMKAEADAAKTDANQNAAMNKFYDDKNRLGPVKKAKGGSIRKFSGGGGIDSDESPLKKISDISGSRFDTDTYARAQRFLETGKKGDDGAATKATYKPSPKNVSTVNSVAKPAPAKTPDKSEAKPTPVKSSDKAETKIVYANGKEPYDLNTPAYPRDAPTLGNRDKSGREQKFDFNAENAATAATLIPGIGAAARLGQGVYRTGKAAYEGVKGLAEGVRSGVSVAKGLNAAEKSRGAAVGAREASNRLANARAADKAKKAAEEAAKQSAKDKKDAGPIFKAAKVRADFNRIDKAAAAKKEAGFKKAAEERRASRTSDESTKMADEGNPNYKKGGAVKKFAKGGMARGYGISKVTNKCKVR